MKRALIIVVTIAAVQNIALATSAAAQIPAPLFTVAEELRIESDESSRERILTDIAGVTVLSDGSIVSAHSTEQRIRVYDSTGRFVRAFGRRGNGPGEFSAITAFGSVGDTIWIYEESRRRFTTFSPTGEFLRTFGFHESSLRGSPVFTALLHDRRILTAGMFVRTTLDGKPWVGPPFLDSAAYLVGKVEDPLLTDLRSVVNQPHQQADMIPFQHNGDSVYMIQPLAPKTFVHVSPGAYHAVVATDPANWGGLPGILRTFSIRPDGNIEMADIVLQPRPLSASRADEARRPRYPPLPSDATPQQRREREGLLASILENLYVPSHAPLAIQMLVGRDGSIWLCDIFDRELWQVVERGIVTKRVRIPESIRVWHATANAVWGAGRNDDDVPYIVRYELRPE